MIPKEDWVLYLEREQDILLFDLFNPMYGERLLKETGYGLTKFLYYFKDGIGVWYRSEQQLKDADKYYSELIKSKDKRIDIWLEKEKECHEIKLDSDNVKELLNKFSDILLYNTVIPFRLLSAMKLCEDKELKKKLDEIRNNSIYLVRFVDLVKQLSKITSLSKDCIRYSLMHEILESIELSEEEIEKRNNGMYWYGEIEYSDTDRLRKIEFDGEISGQIAYEGNATGKVKIVNTLEHISKVEEGDIIVSINTNPSLMPAIKKCGGIVTNEGGITCHAAIVARELKKPCIIGTKIATKVFKDNDIISIQNGKVIKNDKN